MNYRVLFFNNDNLLYTGRGSASDADEAERRAAFGLMARAGDNIFNVKNINRVEVIEEAPAV